MNPSDLFARYVGDVACVCFPGFTHHQIQKPWGSRRGYPPVNSEFANWKIAHFEQVNQRIKWQCSIALLNYQTLCHISICRTFMLFKHVLWPPPLGGQPATPAMTFIWWGWWGSFWSRDPVHPQNQSNLSLTMGTPSVSFPGCTSPSDLNAHSRGAHSLGRHHQQSFRASNQVVMVQVATFGGVKGNCWPHVVISLFLAIYTNPNVSGVATWFCYFRPSLISSWFCIRYIHCHVLVQTGIIVL